LLCKGALYHSKNAFILEFFAVECKKPWNFLSVDIYKKGIPRVVFKLPESKNLLFELVAYIQKFGQSKGRSLFKDVAEEMKACKDSSITVETIRMSLCIVIWKHFGVKWLEIFSCIKESKNITPDEGVDD
jgi:hypothetical protein